MSESSSLISSSSGKFSQLFSTLDEWSDRNPDLFKHLEILTFRNGISQNQFKTKRQGIHKRCLDELFLQQAKLEEQMSDIQKELAVVSQENTNFYVFIGYDNKEYDRTSRKYLFICKTIQIMQIKLLTNKYGFLSDRINDNKQLSQLYISDIVPKNLIYKIGIT